MAYDFEYFAARVRTIAAESLRPAPSVARTAAMMRHVFELGETELAAAEVDLSHVACGPGCGCCCVVNVTVLLAEAIAIVDDLRNRLAPTDLAALTLKIDATYRKIRWLDDEDRILLHQPCPFLDERQFCLIHPVRPLLCRSITSTDPERCRLAVTLPALGENPPVLANLFQKSLFEHVFLGLSEALEECGIDGRGYELTAAVRHLFREPESVSAVLTGRRLPFH